MSSARTGRTEEEKPGSTDPGPRALPLSVARRLMDIADEIDAAVKAGDEDDVASAAVGGSTLLYCTWNTEHPLYRQFNAMEAACYPTAGYVDWYRVGTEAQWTREAVEKAFSAAERALYRPRRDVAAEGTVSA